MDDFFNPPKSSNSADDPTSDFLRREQEALGADAASFGQHARHDPTSFDKDFASGASAFPDLDGADDDDDDDLGGFVSSAAPPANGHGAGHAGVSITANNDLAQFEEEYPEIEMPTAQPSQPIHNNGFTPAAAYSQPSGLFSGTPAPAPEESDFIKSWKVKQQQEISEREKANEAKKEETIAKAQNAIDNFYKEYNAKKEKNIAKNKEEEAAFNAAQTDALAKGTTWERICTLVDLQDSRSKTGTKSKQDLTRFKEILLALKREGDSAPGAAGY